MGHKLRWLSLAVVLGLVLPAGAADDKKEPEKKADSKEKLVVVNQIQGKLTRVEADKKVLEIEIKINKNYSKKEELTILDDVQVLRSYEPVELDEKGKPKKVAPKDRKKPVKGPGNIRGYPAELGDLRNGQTVVLVLMGKKGAKPSKDNPNENKPRVGGALIVLDPKS